VGASGCGKSTLVNLLMGFYQYEGEIFLDKVNIRDFNIHQYRDYFAIVNQEPSLFVGTLE
jgi:ABC-type multidrug transport system fused ATPase/permease subunit